MNISLFANNVSNVGVDNNKRWSWEGFKHLLKKILLGAIAAAFLCCMLISGMLLWLMLTYCSFAKPAADSTCFLFELAVRVATEFLNNLTYATFRMLEVGIDTALHILVFVILDLIPSTTYLLLKCAVVIFKFALGKIIPAMAIYVYQSIIASCYEPKTWTSNDFEILAAVIVIVCLAVIFVEFLRRKKQRNITSPPKQQSAQVPTVGSIAGVSIGSSKHPVDYVQEISRGHMHKVRNLSQLACFQSALENQKTKTMVISLFVRHLGQPSHHVAATNKLLEFVFDRSFMCLLAVSSSDPGSVSLQHVAKAILDCMIAAVREASKGTQAEGRQFEDDEILSLMAHRFNAIRQKMVRIREFNDFMVLEDCSIASKILWRPAETTEEILPATSSQQVTDVFTHTPQSNPRHMVAAENQTAVVSNTSRKSRYGRKIQQTCFFQAS